MFESLALRPLDPILSVGLAYAEDKNPHKVNLGVGVYQDEQGHTPIFKSVKAAEQALVDGQVSKAYVGQAGDPLFLDGLTQLLLGEKLATRHKDRLAAVTTIGGSGALRLAAELTKQATPTSTIWVSNPTWGNHRPLFGAAGMALNEYEYYDQKSGGVHFDRMMDALAKAARGDVVVLHACCHNPTGADLKPAEWNEVFSLLGERDLLPLIDIAYQGFGSSLEEDSMAVRLAAEVLPEVLVASSCSKNFGLYRERSGMLLLIGRGQAEAQAAHSNVLSIARSSYSMPGYHGPAIVGKLLSEPDLRAGWEAELGAARSRIQSTRRSFAALLSESKSATDFSFVAKQRGMFSLLGLSDIEVKSLREEHGVYLVGAARANLAGLAESNLSVVVRAILSVIEA